MISLRLPLSIVLAASAFGGCSADVSPDVAEQGGQPVECALGNSADFRHGCRLVEIAGKGATYFIVRHPDGGFRRLELADSETGFVAGDGAAASSSAREGDYVILSVGGDRYRWKEPVE